MQQQKALKVAENVQIMQFLVYPLQCSHNLGCTTAQVWYATHSLKKYKYSIARLFFTELNNNFIDYHSKIAGKL